MTRLRQMMLEELQRRNYSKSTTRYYLQAVASFARHFGKSPDKLGPDELRSYQAYLLRDRKLLFVLRLPVSRPCASSSSELSNDTNSEKICPIPRITDDSPRC